MIALIETNTGTKPAITLADIEQLTNTFAAAHDVLATAVNELQAETEALQRKYRARLHNGVAAATRAKLALHNAITAAPGLFDKPRTQIFHGIKVGIQKGKGGIEWDDADKVVALIRQHHGKNAIAYIRTTEAPDKKMLADMPAAELKKIGCRLTDTGDVVVIRPTDSEVEKTVAALLASAVEETKS